MSKTEHREEIPFFQDEQTISWCLLYRADKSMLAVNASANRWFFQICSFIGYKSY